jgi:hypothetical protein
MAFLMGLIKANQNAILMGSKKFQNSAILGPFWVFKNYPFFKCI